MRRLYIYIAFMGALLMTVVLTWAETQPIYDPNANPSQDIERAVARASAEHKRIALVFGANWCLDCHALHDQMQKAELADSLKRDFVVVNIDIGRFDKNLDVSKKYHVPVKKGIPVIAILDPSGKLLYAQDQGQFADARHMEYTAIKAFFEHWKPKR